MRLECVHTESIGALPKQGRSTAFFNISTVGAGLFLKEQIVPCPGNADVLVGWVMDDSARSRKRADGDVGVPRIEIAIRWHIHVLKILYYFVFTYCS